MRPEREAKFRRVVSRRQGNLTIVLENVHDPHNVAAVLRSCDSVGVYEIFVLNTERDRDLGKFKMGKRSSMGTRKWIDVNVYDDVEACFAHVRQRHEFIYATYLGENARSLYELDLTQPVALLFGNEHDGISEETLRHTDGNFIIPQMGMAESLNISVACAVSLYEAYRQRKAKGFYEDNPTLSTTEQQKLLTDYFHRHEMKLKNKHPRRFDQ